MTKPKAPTWVVTIMWFGKLEPKQVNVLVSLGFSVLNDHREGWYEFQIHNLKADTSNAALGRAFRWIWSVGVKSIRHEASFIAIESAESWESRMKFEGVQDDIGKLVEKLT